MNSDIKSVSADVAVVGAGPTGLFLANLLGANGISTVLLARRHDGPPPSMAIGVMPPSLKMFESIDLASGVVAAGCPVNIAVVHDHSSVLGSMALSSLPPPYSFVLSIPQGELMRLLRLRLSDCPSVRIIDGCEALGICENGDSISLSAGDSAGNVSVNVSAAFAAACDGSRSRMRELAGIERDGRQYPVSFVMGDFADGTSWTNEAHLFFTPLGSVESFPLPGRRRRWIALADGPGRDTGTLVRRVKEISGLQLDAASELWHSSFTPERRLVRRFYRGRTVLCGDAAHVMSPIGGQGMNTGLADAWMLAGILKDLLPAGKSHEAGFARYDAERRLAFNAAADRAERGMWFGTQTGRWKSAVRSQVIKRLLLRWPLVQHLPGHFAMLTIPGNDMITGVPR